METEKTTQYSITCCNMRPTFSAFNLFVRKYVCFLWNNLASSLSAKQENIWHQTKMGRCWDWIYNIDLYIYILYFGLCFSGSIPSVCVRPVLVLPRTPHACTDFIITIIPQCKLLVAFTKAQQVSVAFCLGAFETFCLQQNGTATDCICQAEMLLANSV